MTTTQSTCKTCHHWRHIRDGDFKNWPGPHGECELFDEDSQDQLACARAKLAWVVGVIDAELILVTKPEFGCNEWELRKEE